MMSKQVVNTDGDTSISWQDEFVRKRQQQIAYLRRTHLPDLTGNINMNSIKTYWLNTVYVTKDMINNAANNINDENKDNDIKNDTINGDNIESKNNDNTNKPRKKYNEIDFTTYNNKRNLAYFSLGMSMGKLLNINNINILVNSFIQLMEEYIYEFGHVTHGNKILNINISIANLKGKYMCTYIIY